MNTCYELVSGLNGEGKGLYEEDVEVEWKDVTPTDLWTEEVRCLVDQCWEQKLQMNPRLFNGLKFRLEAIRTRTDAEKNENARPVWTLLLGLTNYKDYVGVALQPSVLKICQQIGLKQYGTKEALLPNKLGVGCVLSTLDHRIVFLRRSRNVGVHKGLVDIPGGHPEPQSVCILERTRSTDIKDKALSIDIKKEIFLSIINEVRDEVNIPADKLSRPEILGIVLQMEAKTPSITFWMTCALTSNEVNAAYLRGPNEAFESTELLMMSLEEAWVSHANRTIEFTPSALGSLQLFQQHGANTKAVGSFQ